MTLALAEISRLFIDLMRLLRIVGEDDCSIAIDLLKDSQILRFFTQCRALNISSM